MRGGIFRRTNFIVRYVQDCPLQKTCGRLLISVRCVSNGTAWAKLPWNSGGFIRRAREVILQPTRQAELVVGDQGMSLVRAWSRASRKPFFFVF